MKPLYLDTVLAAEGDPAAAIVAPPGERYADAVESIQASVARAAGIRLPVRRDAPNPERLLKHRNVIALGNMATNPFVEHMYRQWYVLLDLKYPGKGGYVVRSLHDPYGTGRNVIWIGGSDDAGVRDAAKAFARSLRPGKPLKVGRLMEIQLGEGILPPKISTDETGWQITSWRDSWRKVEERETGYAPATYFGWNEISVAGVLYYMTGRKEYLDAFKAMAMPKPGRVPKPNRVSSAFNDPLNPLVKNYHYRAHLVPCVFDLIEESPGFTDEERLFITNKLAEQQDHYDPKDAYPKPNSSRHGMWHMLCIYTGSRYLVKARPSPRWQKRMAAVREAFRGWIGNPTWGEKDTLSWVSTSTEPVFEFFMLDGFDEFVASGTARNMMSALEILWTGHPIEESTRCTPISLLHKAAYMMKDGRYIWHARRLGYDWNVFRIGQSFWPGPGLAIEPLTDLVGRASVFPLPKRDAQIGVGDRFPHKEAFQVLSYRSGLSENDDFLQLDGFFGRGRNPYHVNPLYVLRMFGQVLTRGYGNQLTIRRDGMVRRSAAMAAALKNSEGFDGAAYVRSVVPNAPWSEWDRRLMYLRDRFALVLDTIRADEEGVFELEWSWNLYGNAEQRGNVLEMSNRTAVHFTQDITTTLRNLDTKRMGLKALVGKRWTGQLGRGESFSLGTFFCRDAANGGPLAIEPVGANAWWTRGPETILICMGDFDSPTIRFRGEVACVSEGALLLIGATMLHCGRTLVLQTGKPVSLFGDLKQKVVRDPSGKKSAVLRVSSAMARPAIAEALAALKGKTLPRQPVSETDAKDMRGMEPAWRIQTPGRVTNVVCGGGTGTPQIWATAARRNPESENRIHKFFGYLLRVSAEGKIVTEKEFDNEVLTLWPAADAEQAKHFAVLAGCRDDHLIAYDAAGREVLRERAEIHPSFRIGDRYEAPWFTDPAGVHFRRGVTSLIVGDPWGTGDPEIILGRPSTVEFRKLSGELIARVATRWGDNTALAVLRRDESGQTKPARSLVLAAKRRTGLPGVSIIAHGRRLQTNGAYRATQPGTTYMDAWQQRGVSHLEVADLDGDGVEEVVVALSGHWNQVNVYRGRASKGCLWTRCFGPGIGRRGIMNALVLNDLDGNGRRDVVVGMESGWVCAFDPQGHLLWSRRLPAAVRSACALPGRARLAFGCENGDVHLLDGRGKILRRGRTEGEVSVLTPYGSALIAGTDTGYLYRIEVSD